MRTEQHYDEEVLADFLGEPKDSVARDKHLGTCRLCRQALETLRATSTMLADKAVWEKDEFSTAPVPETLALLRSVARQMADEDSVAEENVKQLLAGPRETWAATLQAHPEWRTAGMVRKLIAATDRFNFSSPVDAVELTRVMTEIAGSLSSVDSHLLADAWREHAFALTYVSSYHEALAAVDVAENAFRGVATEFDEARLALMRALVFRLVDRPAEAAAMAESAAMIFKRYNDIPKYVSARMTEGIVLYDSCRYREALTILEGLEEYESAMDASARAMMLHNRAVCYREIGDFKRAETFFAKSVNMFNDMGAYALSARAHWHLARVFMRLGLHQKALPLLEELRSEFEELGMPHVVADVSIDAAEVLLLLGRTDEVVELCRSAMEFFRTAEMTCGPGALTALAYLKEAAANRSLTVGDLQDVRGFFETLPKQPTLVYARAASY